MTRIHAQPRLSVVFLNHNRLQETRETTARLELLTRHRPDIEVIAVDNGSSDGTAQFLAARSDFLRPILLPENFGIGGYNQGFEAARGEHILVLDDDSCPADESVLDLAMDCLERHPEVGIIAGHIETPDGTPQWSWHLPDTIGRAAPSMSFIGCGFFIRRRLFQQIGWYPEHFFLYQNEIQVAINIRLLGKHIRYEPGCRIIHRGTPSQRPGWRRVFFPTRNTLWIIRSHYPAAQAWYLLTSRLTIGLGRALHFGQLRAYLNAVREGLSAPVTHRILPKALRRELRPFWRQNSLFHHFIGRA